MKKGLIALIGVFMLLTMLACSNIEVEQPQPNNDNTTITPDNEIIFDPQSPVSEFRVEDIQALAIDFSGTDMEIAQAIYDWQTEYMDYVAYGEVAGAMRWNYFLPGIYTTKDMIKGFSIMDNINIEGLCYQFATLYCSIANYYELECKVTAMKEKPSDLDPTIDKKTTTGLGEDEYKRLVQLLISKGYYYSYEAIRRVAQETSAHYRAEVKIDNEWVVIDASEYFVGGEYNDIYEFFEVDWLEGYQADILSRSEEMKEVIFIDDLGNEDRASSIDQVRDSQMLVPYLASFDKLAKFLKLPEDVKDELEEEFDLYLQFDQAYFDETGKHFYIVCDFIIDKDASDAEYVSQYEELTGETLDPEYLELMDEITG